LGRARAVQPLSGNLHSKSSVPGFQRNRDKASMAALCPHIPWTPAPGGVDAEQM